LAWAREIAGFPPINPSSLCFSRTTGRSSWVNGSIFMSVRLMEPLISIAGKLFRFQISGHNNHDILIDFKLSILKNIYFISFASMMSLHNSLCGSGELLQFGEIAQPLLPALTPKFNLRLKPIGPCIALARETSNPDNNGSVLRSCQPNPSTMS
jgi:hypothetical protein